jgi:hypothetical protein
MNRRTLGLVLLAVVTPVAAAADPIDLVKYIPTSVNTLCVVNVGQILSSPRAVKGKWSQIDHTEYLAGAVPVNPNVDRILAATEFSPSHPGRVGTVGVLTTKRPVDLAKMAAGVGGEVTTVGGEPAVTGPMGTTFIKIGDQLVGAVTTEHKPDVARFAKAAKAATVSVQSAYLNAAVNNDGLRSHILIAVDVDDMIGPKDAENAVALTDLAKQDQAAAAAVQAFVAGMKGVRIAASVVDDGIAVVVRLDSATDLKVHPDWVKAFVMATLNRVGIGLEDISAAVAKTGEKNVTLSFRLTDPELAFLMSLILPPAAAMGGHETIAVAPKGVTVEATRKYFKAVNQVVDDIKKKNQKAKDYTETAVWHDAAATKIETTSPLGVDPIALEYGRGTAAYLHTLADSLRGVPVQEQVLLSKTYYYVEMGPSFRYVPFRGVGFDLWNRSTNTSTNLPEMQAKYVEAVKQDQEHRAKVWEKIDAERPAVRLKLNEKYKGEFRQ